MRSSRDRRWIRVVTATGMTSIVLWLITGVFAALDRPGIDGLLILNDIFARVFIATLGLLVMVLVSVFVERN